MKNIQLPSLTSLRFFAALMVFFSHMGSIRLNPLTENFYNTWFFEGYSGVTFFFILSGFILAHSYQDRIIEKKSSAIDFYIYRIARIVPLHWLTMGIAIFFLWQRSGSWEFFSHEIFWPNLFLIQAWFSNSDLAFAYNHVAWSLSDEMFFYAMFPLLIRLGTRTMMALLALLVGFMLIWLPVNLPFTSLTIWLFNTDHLPMFTDLGKYYAYWFPLFRIGDFMAGIILYRAWRSHEELSAIQATILQGISLVGLGVFYLFHKNVNDLYRFDLYYALPMAFLIYAFAHQNGIYSRMLSNKVMIILGEASFAFYMIHQLEIEYIGPEIVERIPAIRALYFTPLYNVLIHFIISLTLSLLLFYLFEKNAQRIFNKMLFSIKGFIAGRYAVIQIRQ